MYRLAAQHTTKPTVSVCIPVYNGARYVEATIQSVLDQTLSSFELLILDDCSTDETWSVLGRVRDSRIVLRRNDTHLGAAGTWNAVVRMARGEFCKLLCQDDLIYPECLAAQVGVMTSLGNQGIALVCGMRDIIDERGKVIIRRRGFRESGRLDGKRAILRTVRAGANLFGEPLAVLFKTQTIQDLDGFDNTMRYTIDLDMWCRLLETGDLYALGEPVGAFRVSRQSWSVAIEDQTADFKQFIAAVRKRNVNLVRSIDAVSGSFMARANTLFRKGFYRVFLTTSGARVNDGRPAENDH